MEKTELIFIPWPTMGHFAQLMELAKIMINRDERFSIKILLMKVPDSIDSSGNAAIDSLIAASSTAKGLSFLHLPCPNPAPEWSSRTRGYFVSKMIEYQKSHVEKIVGSSSNLAGFVVDMLCTTMIDVAESFDLPSYVFFASGAGFLSLMLQFQEIQDNSDHDVTEWLCCHDPLIIESFANPIPSSVLPLVLTEPRSWLDRFLHYARGYRKAKGILVNTFFELEPKPLSSFDFPQDGPKIYPIGPILNQFQKGSNDRGSEIFQWLDQQPQGSVVYICFGSQGGLKQEQVKELAHGLERSGQRFLWSLRRPSPKNRAAEFPTEYADYEEVLPEGYLDRTSGVGKVVGWVPQLGILSNPAIGGFISHCGWNSILESIWFGVPIATWPLHSEQQLNAFQLVKELGIGVAITLDYQERREDQRGVDAEEIEAGIRRVMEFQFDSDAMEKVKFLKEKSRLSLTQEGSSHKALGRFIGQILENISM